MESTDSKFTLMAVHAHPDDESIGTGGILVKYSRQGVKTVVVYGTRGEAGDILNTDFVYPSPGLSIKEIRALELEKALQILQVESTYFLGYRDSGMEGSPENLHPQAFSQTDLKEATGRLVKIIRRIRPHVIVTYNEKGLYAHPDHIMANRVTLSALDASGNPEFECEPKLKPWNPSKLYYTAIPIGRLRTLQKWAEKNGQELGFDPEDLGTPDEKITTTVDVREYVSRKLEAIFSHQSQVRSDSFFRRIPEERRDEVFGYEHFVCVKGCTSAGIKETDLFEGLR